MEIIIAHQFIAGLPNREINSPISASSNNLTPDDTVEILQPLVDEKLNAIEKTTAYLNGIKTSGIWQRTLEGKPVTPDDTVNILSLHQNYGDTIDTLRETIDLNYYHQDGDISGI